MSFKVLARGRLPPRGVDRSRVFTTELPTSTVSGSVQSSPAHPATTANNAFLDYSSRTRTRLIPVLDTTPILAPDSADTPSRDTAGRLTTRWTPRPTARLTTRCARATANERAATSALSDRAYAGSWSQYKSTRQHFCAAPSHSRNRLRLPDRAHCRSRASPSCRILRGTTKWPTP
jgi:hypothetical protein